MNGAVVGNGGGQWLVRGSKIAVFELPPATPHETPHFTPHERPHDGAEIDLDLSDAERTSKRQIAAADPVPDPAGNTSEIDVDDILTAVPIDPTVPFEMRVPDKVHARAARLTAQLPQPSARAIVDAPSRSAPPKSSTLFAAVFAVVSVLGVGGGVVAYKTAPIPSATAHAFKAAAAAKVMAQRPSVIVGAAVPTVSVDSLPRARR